MISGSRLPGVFCNIIWEIWSIQPDVVFVLAKVDLLYEPCIFWRYRFFSWLQWLDCMDVSRWIVWIHFWRLFVAIDGKLILHELQYCQKEKCTLQSQGIGQNIALEYFTIFSLPTLSKIGKKMMNIAQRSHFDRSCRSVHVTPRAEILVGIQLDSDWDYLLELGI